MSFAEIDAEKLQSRPQATVQSLARDILEKNGYGKYSHEDECSTNDKNKNESTAATEKRSETTKQQTERKGNSGTTQKTLGQEVHTLTEKQKKAIEAKRLAALARRQQHLISLSANHVRLPSILILMLYLNVLFQQKEKVIPAVNSTRTCGSNPRQQQYHIISPVESMFNYPL
jgi:archaellum component FlaD/FlaE